MSSYRPYREESLGSSQVTSDLEGETALIGHGIASYFLSLRDGRWLNFVGVGGDDLWFDEVFVEQFSHQDCGGDRDQRADDSGDRGAEHQGDQDRQT